MGAPGQRSALGPSLRHCTVGYIIEVEVSVPRSPEEHLRRARKYGRRARLGEARSSREAMDREVLRLLGELKASSVPKDVAKKLRAQLKVSTDDRRRGNAIWAIVDALEAAERQR
jgi:hypothetical protein